MKPYAIQKNRTILQRAVSVAVPVWYQTMGLNRISHVTNEIGWWDFRCGLSPFLDGLACGIGQ